MLETLQQAGWIAALAFLAAVIGLSAIKSSQQSPPYNHEQPAKAEKGNAQQSKTKIDRRTDQNEDSRNQKRKWYNTFVERPTEWLLVLFNFLLASFSLGLWWSTWGLWDAAEEQSRDIKASITIANRSAKAAEDTAAGIVASIDAARDNVARQLRAYVYVEPIKLKSLTSTALVQIDLVMHNIGQTPVYRMVHVSGINIGPHPFPKVVYPSRDEAARQPDFKETFFGKDVAMTKTAERLFTDEEIANVLDGKKFRLYFHGLIYYHDIFNNIWHTEFCYMYYGQGARNMAAEYCETGNDAN